MLQRKIVVSVFFGTLMYVFASVFLGPEGISAANQLKEQGQIISTNVQKLQQLNDTLSLDFLGLRGDAEVVKAYAKRLGYIESDQEKLVKINGFSDTKIITLESGFALDIADIEYISERGCKIIGILFFILSFITMQLIAVRKKKPVFVDLSSDSY